MTMNVIGEVMQSAPCRAHECATVDQFYERSVERLSSAATSSLNTNQKFIEAWRAVTNPMKAITVLVLTATDSEDDAFIKAVKSAGYTFVEYVGAGESVGAVYASGNTRQIIQVRSSAGSTGTSGSELTSSDAIEKLAPDYVLSVGICFGMKQKDQKLGDVLVSEKIVDYEMVRVGRTDDRDRGIRAPSAARLLSVSRQLAMKYDKTTMRVVHGEIISGSKLVDSADLLNQLKASYPDAIGGEMEGTGIVAASNRLRRDWLVIKGICDWGKGKHSKDQNLAADNAFAHALQVIKTRLDIDLREDALK
jgi:nucleoside phosphorylase